MSRSRGSDKRAKVTEIYDRLTTAIQPLLGDWLLEAPDSKLLLLAEMNLANTRQTKVSKILK